MDVWPRGFGRRSLESDKKDRTMPEETPAFSKQYAPRIKAAQEISGFP